MSEAKFRAFLGLPIPATAMQSLCEMQAMFRESGLRATWVAPENFHITLCFLGNMAYSQLDTLDGALESALTSCGAIQFAVDGAGTFPDLDHPAVVWAGLRTLSGDVGGLYEAACVGAATMGVTPDRHPFQPHVTLCRLRHGHPPSARLREALEAARNWNADDFWVESVALWRSELRRGGAVYHPIKEYPLQCLPSTS